MADSKITALTAISTVDPTADPLVIVDVSDTSMAASGTTKKGTINQLLGAGGTATLASATITGDLTARNWFVTGGSLPGVGNGNPFAYRIGGGGLGIGAATETGTTAPIVFYAGQGGVEQYRIAPLGVNTWSDGAGGTRMTLNATGLGVGRIPTSFASTLKVIQIGDAGSSSFTGRTDAFQNNLVLNAYDSGSNAWIYIQSTLATRYSQNSGAHQWFNAPSGTAGNAITFTQAMTLDASGNLLVGTTDASSTSGAGFKIIGSGLGPYVVNAASTNAALAYTMYSTGAAAYRFYVGWGGTVFATNTTISAISDARLKENVQDIDVGLGAILALKPRKFDWKAGKGKDIKGDRGFIAQEFEQVFPQLVDEWKDAVPEGEAPYKSVRQDLIPVLVKAIQELTARVQTLEAK